MAGNSGLAQQLPQPSDADTMTCHTFRDALRLPTSSHFWVQRDSSGKWTTGHRTSYYAPSIDDSNPTFDVSNGKVLSNVGPNGELRSISFFGATYLNPEAYNYPGGWFSFKIATFGPYSFAIEIDGKREVPAKSNWPCRTSFLANVIPLTKYQAKKACIDIVTFAPVSASGERRPRAAIHGLYLRNTSAGGLKGNIIPPWDPKLLMTIADGRYAGRPEKIAFSLSPGEGVWVPLVIAAAGDDAAVAEIRKSGPLPWLAETCRYFNGSTGRFSMPDDALGAELFQRLAVQCLSTCILDEKGEIAGGMYGTYPPSNGINMREIYYAVMPACQRDPKLFRRFIPWSVRYAVHPGSTHFPGGISHSLGSTLQGVVYAGLYYAATGDRAFFAENPKLKQNLVDTLESVIKSRKTDDVWLFPSLYIADGRSLGDYHTGSNVCAWYSFQSFARILDEAYGDKELAKRYRDVTGKIKKALEKHNIIEGPFGKQYIEGVNRDGSIPVMIHDGEESDVTLMPFYGYAPFDAPAYRNYNRFAFSPHNVAYCPETRGIVWENYGKNAKEKPSGPLMCDGTMSSYATALANVTDRESMIGNNGSMTELERLADVSGCMWWWPYGKAAKRSKVIRGLFECGFAPGVFLELYTSEFLGLRYDAPTRSLHFRPFNPSSDFTWEDFPLGSGRFSVAHRRRPGLIVAEVANRNPFAITSTVELILPDKDIYRKMKVGDQLVKPSGTGTFLGRNTVQVSRVLAPGQHIVVTATTGKNR